MEGGEKRREVTHSSKGVVVVIMVRKWGRRGRR